MKKAYLITAIFLGIILIVDTLISVSNLSMGIKIYMTQVVFVTSLHLAAAIILVLAIKGFRERLKNTYLLICGSMLLIAFGLVQDLTLVLLGLHESTYVLLGGTYMPYVFMMFLAYFGVRLLAKQLLVKSVFLNPWVVIGAAVVAALVVSLIPTTRVDYPTYGIHIVAFIDALVVLLVAVTMLAFKTMGEASVLYRSALRWLGIYYGSIALVTTANLIAEIYLPHAHWYWAYGVSYTIYNFTAIAAVIAGLRFSKIAYAEVEIIKQVQRHGSSAQPVNSVDVIMSLVQLTSNPRSIDNILDALRRLTASLDTKEVGRSLTVEQQATAAQIYGQVEDFLIDKEPVRRFTADQLRQMVDIRFQDAVQEPTFWKNAFKD